MENSFLALEAKKIDKVYRKANERLQVLERLDLRVLAGEKIAVTGTSGSGKSTLLHLLGTLDRPDGGEITFFGKPAPFTDDRKLSAFRNREIGFVFQFHHLLPEFTALENVTLPALIAGQSRRLAEARAHELLERCGLSNRVKHRPGELSGGEQQRVAIARALSLKPRLLLADEPTGNLDAENGERVQELLLELQREHHTTLIIATHNMDLARKMDRVLRLHNRHLEECRA